MRVMYNEGSGGCPRGKFFKFQVYSGKFVKITTTFEADYRRMEMLQLAVIAVSNEKNQNEGM